MKNYADLGGCYPPQRPSASADNTLLDLHNSSYHTQPHPIIANYPVLRQSTPLNAIPKLEHLKARRELNRQEKDLLIEWATTNGKGVQQRRLRQETTMFKAGTLPLNMYRTSDYPKDKVSFSHYTVEEQPATSATTVTPFISH